MKRTSFNLIKQRGVSLMEVIFALGIVIAMGAMWATSQVRERNIAQARNTGKQMQNVGMAVSTYIVNRYATVSTLTSSPGTPADPGPRTCVAATASCTITLNTLVADGLLPTGFAATPPFTGYTITLRRTGTTPNWTIDGLTTTVGGWVEPSTAIIKYDLVGEAVRAIGPDGGMTYAANTISGYQGTWTESSANYPSINALGQIAVRSGNWASMFSQFLRRDGTLPMTGNLDMGGNQISNAGNISTGTGCKRTEMTSAGQIFSRDAGCVTRFQTDPATGSTSANNTAGAATVTMDGTNGRLATNGYSPSDIPAGWGGGVRTLDAYAGGTVAVGPSSGTTSSYNSNTGVRTYSGNAGMNNTGAMWANGDLTVKGDIFLGNRRTPLSQLLPSYTSRGAFVIQTHNARTWCWGAGCYLQPINKPDCGNTGGSSKIIVTPSTLTSPVMAVNAGATSGISYAWNNTGHEVNVLDYGGYWLVHVGGWPGSPYNTLGYNTGDSDTWSIAHTYCYFGPGT